MQKKTLKHATNKKRFYNIVSYALSNLVFCKKPMTQNIVKFDFSFFHYDYRIIFHIDIPNIQYTTLPVNKVENNFEVIYNEIEF